MTIMREWLQTGQPAPVPGIASEDPSNRPMPRKPGQAASGHPLSDTPPGGDPNDPGRVDRHLWQQVTRPAAFADLATVSGSGPLASSIECHQGKATLQRLDQATAANPSLAPQLGSRAPSGNPVRPGAHQAPSGQGETFGTTPMRNPGSAYQSSAIGGQRPAGFTMYPARSAPGE